MNLQMTLSIVGASLLLASGLTACDRPNPAETAGRKIDRAADSAGKRVGDAADKLGEEGARAGVAIADAEITTRVKGAILAEPGLRSLQISVDTVAGVVVLTGSVDSRWASERAGELAAVVAGVRKVENRLQLKPAR